MAVETTWPVSIWQRRTLDSERRRPGLYNSPDFTISARAELHGTIDAAVLTEALAELLRRHEILRTRVVDDGRRQMQVVSPSIPNVLEVVDEVKTHWPVPADGPSPLLVRLSDNEMSVHLHHLACDPFTVWGVLRELGAIYTASTGGGPIPPAPSAQFGEFAQFEIAQEAAGHAAAEQWWRSCFIGTEFASVRPTDSVSFEYRGEILTAERFAGLERLGRTYRGTIFTTLVAALACAMQPHISGGDLLFSTVFRKRDRPEWQRMLGPCFVEAYLPIPQPPAVLSPEYARTVRDTLLNCQRHSRFDLTEIWAMNPVMANPREIVTFFEYVPRDRPADIAFGPTAVRVVDAAGPANGGVIPLAVRARDDETGALVAHVCARAGGWSESAAAGLWSTVSAVVDERSRGGQLDKAEPAQNGATVG